MGETKVASTLSVICRGCGRVLEQRRIDLSNEPINATEIKESESVKKHRHGPDLTYAIAIEVE